MRCDGGERVSRASRRPRRRPRAGRARRAARPRAQRLPRCARQQAPPPRGRARPRRRSRASTSGRRRAERAPRRGARRPATAAPWTTRIRGASAARASDDRETGEGGAHPIPRAIARIASRPARSRHAGDRDDRESGRRRQQEADGTGVEQRGEREADDGQQRHDARREARLRRQRADLGVHAAPFVEPPRERAQERGQVASRRAAAATPRRPRSGHARPSAAASAAAMSSPAAARRPASANASPGPAAGDRGRAQRAIRRAPGSELGGDTPQRIRQLALECALGAHGAAGVAAGRGHALRSGARSRRTRTRPRPRAARRSCVPTRRSDARPPRAGRPATRGRGARHRGSRRAGARRRCRRATCTTTSNADATCSRTAACGSSSPAISARSSMRRSASSGALRVHGRERPVVSGRHRLEHVERLAAAHLAHDEPVGPHAQRVAHELADADLAAALETRAARLEARDVRPVDAQLGCVLDGDDALRRVDARGERAEQRRLAARRSAADDDRETRAHARRRAVRRPRR